MLQIISCIMSCFSRHTVASAFGLNTLLPLLLHLLRRRVVDVGLALSEQLFSKLHDDGKMVAGVGELVWLDLEHGNIFQDHLRSTKASFGIFFHHISKGSLEIKTSWQFLKLSFSICSEI